MLLQGFLRRTAYHSVGKLVVIPVYAASLVLHQDRQSYVTRAPEHPSRYRETGRSAWDAEAELHEKAGKGRRDCYPCADCDVHAGLVDKPREEGILRCRQGSPPCLNLRDWTGKEGHACRSLPIGSCVPAIPAWRQSEALRVSSWEGRSWSSEEAETREGGQPAQTGMARISSRRGKSLKSEDRCLQAAISSTRAGEGVTRIAAQGCLMLSAAVELAAVRV